MVSTETDSIFQFGQRGSLIPIKVTYSIQPAQSLIESSDLIVDYIADKIEQSVSIQQIFNELLRFFETEALCLGPSFTTLSDDPETATHSGPVALRNLEDNSFTDDTVSNVARSESEILEEMSPKGPNKTGSFSQTNDPYSGVGKSKAVPHTGHQIKTQSPNKRPKVLGFRIVCSGRLQISSFSKPAEMAESIELTRGVLPLNTFAANIDFSQTHATNAYGTCGIKV